MRYSDLIKQRGISEDHLNDADPKRARRVLSIYFRLSFFLSLSLYPRFPRVRRLKAAQRLKCFYRTNYTVHVVRNFFRV